jgi:hypothetical protein
MSTLLTYVISGLALLGFGVVIWNGVIVPMWHEADPNRIPVVRVVKDEDENE